MFEGNFSFESIIHAVNNKSEGDYWQKKLSGNLVKSVFPYDHDKKFQGKGSLTSGRATETITFTLPRQLFWHLLKVSNGSDARLNMALITGIIILLYKYTGSRDILVGMPIYKQENEGNFINTVLPLRNQIVPAISFKELLLNVRQTIIAAIKNQNYPMEALLYQLGISFEKGEDFPLFDVAVLLKNIHDKEYLRHLHLNMIFSFLRTEESLEAEIEYNASLYGKETIEPLVAHFFRIMDEVLQNANLKVAEIDILSGEEKKQQLVEFNKTQAQYPYQKTIQELFEEQVERAPHYIAIVFGDQQVTYRELNKRANQLARKLRGMGVGPDNIVGLMMDRSIEMLVGILAVLKAGSAYLPIDPELPELRILQMLEDCQAPILLTKKQIMGKKSFIALQGLQKLGIKPYRTPPRPQITDLDALPIPNRSLINYEKYNQYIGLMMVKNCMSLQASRGCPFHCAYCHNLWPKTHMIRSAENIFAEVQLYYNLGVRRFSFVDDVFNLNVKNSQKFFQLIIENGLEVQLFFGLRGDILTREYIDLMVKAGTVRMAMALETASPRLQKLIRKNLDIEKLQQNIDYITKKYPHVLLELHTIVGIITETEEEARMTLDFIKGLKWVDFNNVNVLKIYPNTYMEQLALENGISPEAIARSSDLGYHELPETLPFDKSFVLQYQSEFFNDYFLSKERLLNRLPYQMKVLTEDEMVQKYNSYLPVEINSLDDLLQFLGISIDELGCNHCRPAKDYWVPNLNQKLKACFPREEDDENALRVLLLDLSQYFSYENSMLYDVVEAPIGLMYIMTHLKQQFGRKVKGKIAKSRIDFNNYDELKELLLQFKPQVIGIRTLTFFKNFFHKTVSILRQWGIDVPIIAGGPYATSDYFSILQDRNVDLIVLGEGEKTFAEIIGKMMENNDQLPGDETLKEIDGITFIPKEKAHQQGFSRHVLMSDMLDVEEEPRENPVNINRPSDSAYIIFTSGSTGKPKGVVVEHKNVVNVVSWYSRQYNLQGGTNVLQMSDYTFDASVNQILGTLLHGATLHVIGKPLLMDIEALRRYIQDKQIYLLNFVPAMFRELLAKGEKLESLRAVISGGERLDDVLKDTILKKGYDLYNQYGPTETTIDALVEKCSQQRVTLGAPIANVTCLILNQEKKLVPIGTAGELFVGGDGIARGYLNNPELTGERFVTHPFEKGKRMYRTGDLACLLPEGKIKFLGRKDSQVKIRGYRIEPHEIEHQLLKYDGIREAVVVEKNRHLCAYIVSDRHFSLFRSDLVEYLRQRLPHYMVPTYFLQLSKIPLTPIGKVDVKALSAVDATSQENWQTPSSEIEEKMADLWADVLKVEKNGLSINANFFELGGHSLKAVSLINKIHEVFNVKIPLAEIFRTPTIKGISRIIKESAQNKFCSIKPAEKKEYYLLSSAQKRLFVLQNMELENISYNTPKIMVLEGDFEIRTFEDSYKRLIGRHESLRTSFKVVDEEPVQMIHLEVEFEIEYYNMESLVYEKEAELDNTIANFVRPFDLTRAPLLRVGLIETGQKSYILMTDMHHIISDGASQSIFINEILDLYAGKEPSPLSLQYKDYSEWQNSKKEREKLGMQEKFWLEELAKETPPLTLPYDFPRPEMQNFEGNRLTFEVERDETKALRKMAREENTTLFVLLLAIFNLLIAKLTGQEEIVVGSPVAGRRHADLQQIIGMFVNMIPLKNYPRGTQTFKDFLENVKERTLAALENQDYQFEELVKRLNLNRNPSRNPIFDVAFALHNMDMPEVSLEGLRMFPYESRFNTSKFDLTLSCGEGQEQLLFTLEYSTKLFEQQTIKRLIDRFREIISNVIENKDIQLQDIRISHHLLPSQVSVEKEEYMAFGF